MTRSFRIRINCGRIAGTTKHRFPLLRDIGTEDATGPHGRRPGAVELRFQQPGSDADLWKDKPLGERMHAMQEAAGASGLPGEPDEPH